VRILFVSSLWPPEVVGGAERYAAELADHLTAAGHDVGVVTLGSGGDEVVATVRPLGYPLQAFRGQPPWRRFVFHAADTWRPAGRRAVAEACDRFRPDVVHTHTVQGLSVAALAEPGRRHVPHVHTLHDYWLLCWRTTLQRRDGRGCGPACTAIRAVRSTALRGRHPAVVTAASHAVLDEHRRRGVTFPSSVTRVLRHPVDPARARPVRSGGPPTFGYLGQVNPNKGIRTLLAAFARSGIDGARLLVAGRGRLVDAVLGAGPGVEYLGWLDGEGKESFFDDIDALVVPSEWAEPAGLVIDEARARGIPVVAAAIGGIPEYVHPASQPLLFRSGDADGLATAMRAVAADPTRYRPEPPGPDESWERHVTDVTALYELARGAVPST
jgi:glycosyltransferase involved in cell wall biosynthesis